MMTLRVTRAVTAITVLNMTSCKLGKSSIKKLIEISSGKCNPFLYQLGLESDYGNHLIKGGPIPGSFCHTFKLVCTCDNLQEHYYFKNLKTKCSNPRKKRLEKFRPCCTKRSQRLTLSGACATLRIKSHSFRANIWVWSSSESLMPLCSRRKTSSQNRTGLRRVSPLYKFHVFVICKNHYLSLFGFRFSANCWLQYCLPRSIIRKIFTIKLLSRKINNERKVYLQIRELHYYLAYKVQNCFFNILGSCKFIELRLTDWHSELNQVAN